MSLAVRKPLYSTALNYSYDPHKQCRNLPIFSPPVTQRVTQKLRTLFVTAQP
jgi:hypothetical protein